MSRNLFLGSGALCLLFLGLSQLPDPAILGIDGEPERIMFYGGTGLLAGIFGVVALGSGLYLAAARLEGASERRRRFLLILMWVVLGAVSTVSIVRFCAV